jgi:hypothetical protein
MATDIVPWFCGYPKSTGGFIPLTQKLRRRSIRFEAISQNDIRIVLDPYIIWIARSYPVRKESRNRK